MHAGFYTIASGMLTQQRDIDVIANNLINTQTPGYRADKLLVTSFEKELAIRQEYRANADFGTGTPAAIVDQVVPLMQNGEVKDTGRSLDLAINGEGYFTVEDEEGTVYLTRGGQFDIDEEGNLILPGVGQVLGDGGALQVVGPGFVVDEDGNVFNQAGEELGLIQLSMPPEDAVMVKLENGMFQVQDGEGEAVDPDTIEAPKVIQGALELSNVDMNKELTAYIEVQRAFQSCSSALQIIDGMNRKSIAQIAAI